MHATGKSKLDGKAGVVLITALLALNCMYFVPMPSSSLDVSMDTNLADADASFWGEDVDDYSGAAVAGAGDVNGDGYDDILIGAYAGYGGGSMAGQTYLILGKASGWSMDTFLSNVDASFLGEDGNDYSGISVAGAGDVNGDGYDDILIGASGDWDGGKQAGQTYLILGNATGWAMDTDLSNASGSFWGEAAHDKSGMSVAGAGDVNGDGYDDILIGACGNGDGGGYHAGQTYLILGNDRGWAMDTNLSTADASFWGENKGDQSGYSVAGAGDVNGDGYDDFLIGAYGNGEGGGSAGQTYLIFGKASGWTMDTDLSNADASFWGEDSQDNSGFSVAGAGDVNGDGYDDILIGAHGDDDSGSGAGQSYLILGRVTGWAMDTDLSTADASFRGEDAGDCSGYSVAGAGDVNGDGYEDILIGAHGYDDVGYDAGQTYLILGRATGWAMDIDLSKADASFLGEEPGDRAGERVAGTGDVNGDGYHDILIAAYFDDDGESNAGQTYLIFPFNNSQPTEIISVKIYSDGNFTSETSTCVQNDTLYIELRGIDGDPAGQDTVYVNVWSNESFPMGFVLGLLESGTDTGVYRSNVIIGDKTLDRSRWIEAYTGETVGIHAVLDPSRKAVVLVGPLTLFPIEDDINAVEDLAYYQKYWTNDFLGVEWTLGTDADWLVWDVVEHTISGIPDNGDVGDCWVRLGVSWGGGIFADEHNFTVAVGNTPPEITTGDVVEAWEDGQYHQDYNSSDDGQGDISWHLETDAGSWLSIDIDTGDLFGIPSNDDVGEYDVNVSVHDGNGGWNRSQFTLTVHNTNDRPFITREYITEAYEDELYELSYDVSDVDVADTDFDWKLTTDASWLDLDDEDHISGTPTNDDVGTYDVNVSVTDGNGGFDYREFVLTVHNTNDAPVWVDVPMSTVLTAGDSYDFNVNSMDIDVGDTLTYAVEPTTGLTIDAETGVLQWTTNGDDVGLHTIDLSVSDGDATIYHDFTIEILPLPEVVLFFPGDGAVLNTTDIVLEWSLTYGDLDSALYEIFLDVNDPPAKKINPVIGSLSTSAKGLEDGTTYYWMVIPSNGTYIGTCSSGVWSFSIDLDSDGPPINDSDGGVPDDGDDEGGSSSGGDGSDNLALFIAVILAVIVVVVIILIVVLKKKKKPPVEESETKEPQDPLPGPLPAVVPTASPETPLDAATLPTLQVTPPAESLAPAPAPAPQLPPASENISQIPSAEPTQPVTPEPSLTHQPSAEIGP